MRTLRAVSVAVLLLAGRAGAAPRLGVVVVVDQMRPDYLERSDLPDGGFRRLREDGARFVSARHLHLPTTTAPGHAAISTGRQPSEHGIVANEWYDRRAATETSSVTDAAYGIGPEHLRGPTLADALKAKDPKARVFAIAGKDRGAVLMGGRRADLVLWFDRFAGEFTTSSYYRRPAWLDEFNAELKKDALLPRRGERVPKELLATPAMDEATDRLAAELISRERVGRGPSLDLLMVSYSGMDLVGHRYGTQSPQMDAEIAAIDAILGGLLRRVQTASGGDYALAFTADHGAIPTPEDADGAKLGVRRKDWLKFRGELEAELQKEWPSGPWIVSYKMPHIYLNRAQARARGLDWRVFLRRAAKALARADGVGRALAGEDSLELPSSDPLADALRRSWRADRSGDILVFMGENILLHDQVPGTSHGSPWDYDARVPLVFLGPGVAPGRYPGPSATVDIAPTLGRLLGFDYPAGEGGVVRLSALREPR